MKIYDLSQPLNQEVSFWPYYPPFEVKYIKRKAEHGVNAQYIQTSNHMGTHLDAPRHFVTNGRTIDEIPVEWLCGPGAVVDLRDEMGDLGVAVQSHFFGAGSLVVWAEAGVGAVATQSIIEVSYGPLGLSLMRSGIPADECLGRLLGDDPMAALRQVAMIDASGLVGTHTGTSCIGKAGHRQGRQVSAQANMMERDTVWEAMIDAYHGATDLDLAERLLVALEAAESEGGDVRGVQSAAILVVSGARSDAPWNGKKLDLRVEDSEQPLMEMRRLLGVSRGIERFRNFIESGVLFGPDVSDADPRFTAAVADLVAAQQALGTNREPSFWKAVLLAKAGRIDEARASLAFAAETNPRWKYFLQSIAASGLLPADSPLLVP
jgi:uncharacterized Ntn-hydrolase superfamily protein